MDCHDALSLSIFVYLSMKITPKKLINAAKITASFYRSKALKKPLIAGLPISIAYEPTTACNLRCPECPSGLRAFTRPTGMLKMDDFIRTIDQLADTLIYLTFYFQGEPFLNPDFLEMTRYASQKGIYTATSTNAHYLKPATCEKIIASGLDRLIISIDGTTQDTYESYRIGGSLERVIEGTRNIVAAKKKLRSSTPHLIFQFLVVRPNQHQIPQVRKLAKQLGVSTVALKTAQIYDFENGSPLIPTIDRYSRYRRNPDGTYSIKNRLENSCWKMWHSCVITWDGKVVPCCFDKDARYTLGDLNHTDFRQVWFSEPYNRFRQMLLLSRKSIDICRNCTEGMRVWK